MGQKCSCFDKEVESKLEKNDFSISIKKEKVNENDNEGQIKKAKERNSYEKSNLNEKLSNNNYNIKLRIIIKNISSWFFRKKFLENSKKSLEEHSEKLFEQLYSSESIRNLNKISEKIKINFDVNGWKEYYEEFPLKIEDLPD
jgi:hypothetical protein